MEFGVSLGLNHVCTRGAACGLIFLRKGFSLKSKYLDGMYCFEEGTLALLERTCLVSDELDSHSSLNG